MSYLDAQRKLPKVPVRYTGAHVVRLRQVDGPQRDANNVPLESLLVPKDQTLQMSAIEVYGTTYLFDPRGEKPTEWLGLGRVVLDKHHEYATSPVDLERIGYEFHEGRSDVEPLVSLEEFRKRLEPAPAEQQSAPDGTVSGGSEVKEEGTDNAISTTAG
jgi:hypothetical protein